MLKRILATRAFMSLTAIAITVVVAVSAYFVIYDPDKPVNQYCAMMPDAVGLYTGNHVTMRGIAVGSVTRITPDNTGVRVEFTVDATHPLPQGVSATTLSDTLVADRSLAVVPTTQQGGTWNRQMCITRTLTPKSITQTLGALKQLSSQLTNAGGHGQQQVGDGIDALATATAGTGPEANALITKLAAALDSPDQAIGHIGDLIDALSSLSTSVDNGWADIKKTLIRFADALDIANNEILGPAAELFDSLRRVLELGNDITTLYGGPITRTLDATVPALRWVGAHVGTLEEIIAMTPAIAGAFRQSSSPATNAATITYAAPRAALPAPAATQLCIAINALAPGRCTSASDRFVTVQMTPLILGLIGRQ